MSSELLINQFKESFGTIADQDILKQYDQWLILIEKTANLILASVSIFITALSIYLNYEFTLPLILVLSLALFGFGVSSFIGIGYRFHIAKNNIYGRIKFVLVGISAILFGLPMTLIFAIFQLIMQTPDNFVYTLAFGCFLVLFTVLLFQGKRLDYHIREYLHRKIKLLLIEPIKPFSGIFLNIFTFDLINIRLLATCICMAYTSLIIALLIPISYEFYVFIFAMLFFSWIMRGSKYLNHLVAYRDVLGNQNIASFCATTAHQLDQFGIKEYAVHYETPSFDNTHIAVFSTIIIPIKNKPILVLHSMLTKIDEEKIQKELNERWSTEVGIYPLGPAICPFRFIDGRILIDESILNAEKLLWTTTDIRIDLVVNMDEITKLSYDRGDYTKFFFF